MAKMKLRHFRITKRKFISVEIIVSFVCLHLTQTHGLDLSQCRNSLGMQSGDIPDSAITASSSYDDAIVGPKNARIRTEKNGGAWCPKPSISRDSYEFLQIDLGKLTVITMVEIQGRFGNGQGQEFTEEFLLEYQREDGGEWMRFRNKRGKERFEGNTNTYLAELRQVEPPIIGKRMRFIPYCSHPRTVCMRVEIYGCPWEDGVVSYNMKQGEKRGAEVDFYDFTYDGVISTDHLSNGLGQLTDGEIGDTNFRLDPQDLGIKGYEWVGWKNDTVEDPGPVTLIFKFDTVRNFTSMKLFCNNYFSKDVRVFRVAVIYHSIGGEYFTRKPDKFNFIQDTVVELARYVRIKLDHVIARYIKIELYFDAKWILISEVQFDSVPAKGNFTPELPPPTTQPTTTRKVKPFFPAEIDIETGGAKIDIGGPIETLSPDGRNPDDERVYRFNNGAVHKTEEKKSFEEQYIGIIIGALAFLIVVLFAIVLFIIIRHKKHKHNSQHGIKSGVDHVTLNVNSMHMNGMRGTMNGKLSNGNMYNGVATDDDEMDHICNGGDKILKASYSEPKDSIHGRNLPDLPSSSETTGTAMQKIYSQHSIHLVRH